MHVSWKWNRLLFDYSVRAITFWSVNEKRPESLSLELDWELISCKTDT